MVGAKYPTWAALYRAVMNCDPPKSGGANIRRAYKELQRYVRVHSAEGRSVIVDEIYDQPLPKESGRGRAGKYANYLRPILVAEKTYKGRLDALPKKLGLFDAYYAGEKDLKSIDAVNIQSAAGCQQGEQTYRHVLQNKQKEVIISALNSLKSEGILTWERYYLVSFPLTEDCDDEQPAYFERQNAAAGKKNSCLDAELIRCLLAKEEQWSEPRRPTEQEKTAIENIQMYLRQEAFSKHYNLPELPERSAIIEQGKFFSNAGLAAAYAEMSKKLLPWLLGGTFFWQELQFAVTNTAKAKKYIPADFDKAQYAEMVTKELLRYMDARMNKIRVHGVKGQTDDVLLGLCSNEFRRDYTLSKSKSATRIHKELMALYGLKYEDKE